jgi:IS30 family transposase
MHVSHQTIYLMLFIQARGGLKRELTQHLRTGRANRRPKGTKPPSKKGRIVDPVIDLRASRRGRGSGRARPLGR